MKIKTSIFFFLISLSMFCQSSYKKKFDRSCKQIKSEIINSNIKKKHKSVLYKMVEKLNNKELKERLTLFNDTLVKFKVVYNYKIEEFFIEETYTNQTLINGFTKDSLFNRLDKVSDKLTDIEDDYLMSLDFYQGKKMDDKAKSIIEKKEKKFKAADKSFWECRNKLYYYNSTHKFLFTPKRYISTLKSKPFIKEMEEVDYYSSCLGSYNSKIDVLHPVFPGVYDSVVSCIPTSTKRKSHFYVIEVTLKSTNNESKSLILIPKKTNIYFKTRVIAGTPSF